MTLIAGCSAFPSQAPIITGWSGFNVRISKGGLVCPASGNSQSSLWLWLSSLDGQKKSCDSDGGSSLCFAAFNLNGANPLIAKREPPKYVDIHNLGLRSVGVEAVYLVDKPTGEGWFFPPSHGGKIYEVTSNNIPIHLYTRCNTFGCSLMFHHRNATMGIDNPGHQSSLYKQIDNYDRIRTLLEGWGDK